MISTRRKPFATGQSQGITLPAAMKISKEGISMAAGDRLIIMDTTGEVPEDKLLQSTCSMSIQLFTTCGSHKNRLLRNAVGYG